MSSAAKVLSDRIGRALALGLADRHQDAWAEIKAAVAPDSVAMYATVCGLAEVAVADRVAANPGGVFGLAVKHEGRPAGAQDAPAPQRLAMQIMAAQANRDFDTTKALFKAAMNMDPASVADATLILYQAALKTSRERIARGDRRTP
jgi:hypothetical protein